MTRDGKLALLAAVGLGVVIVASGTLDLGGLRAGVDLDIEAGDAPDVGERASRRHPNRGVSQPGLMTGPHPLYRRPRTPGGECTLLQVGGWDWYLNPPSEWT